MRGPYFVSLLLFSLVNPAHGQQAPHLSFDRSGVISWIGEYGVVYQLQSTPQLEGSAWTNVTPAITGEQGSTIVVTNTFPAVSQAFYRVTATNFICANYGGATCASAYFLGEYDADVSGAFLCTRLSCTPGRDAEGCGSAWFIVRLRESSDCNSNLRLRANLQSPPGVNYDLYLYRGCGTLAVTNSTFGAGALDSVIHNVTESGPADDSTNVWIEIRHVSGSQPGNWMLSLRTRDCRLPQPPSLAGPE